MLSQMYKLAIPFCGARLRATGPAATGGVTGGGRNMNRAMASGVCGSTTRRQGRQPNSSCRSVSAGPLPLVAQFPRKKTRCSALVAQGDSGGGKPKSCGDYHFQQRGKLTTVFAAMPPRLVAAQNLVAEKRHLRRKFTGRSCGAA